jgi:Family of unknown function (DUF6338)
VPNSLEAAIVFTLVIAPGYLFVRGFSVGRTHVPPERDLYVLAEAIVASVVWLVVVYLVARGRLDDYGLLPRDDKEIESNGTEVARLLLVVVIGPYFLGRILGWVTRMGLRRLEDAIEGVLSGLPKGRSGPWKRLNALARAAAEALSETAALTPPTAWDRAWSRRERAKVTVHLKEGSIIHGTASRVDRSPLPHQVFLSSGDGFDEDGNPMELAEGRSGVFLEAAEIRAVFFD